MMASSSSSSPPECGVCFLAFDQDVHAPLSLPCGHSFCRHCMLKVQGCPNRCDVCFTFDSLRPNYAMLDVIAGQLARDMEGGAPNFSAAELATMLQQRNALDAAEAAAREELERQVRARAEEEEEERGGRIERKADVAASDSAAAVEGEESARGEEEHRQTRIETGGPISEALENKVKGQGAAPVSLGSALLEAARVGDTAALERLLGAGVDVNAEDTNGKTASMHGAQRGHAEVVRLLIAAPGMKINKANDAGMTALMFAAHKGHTEVVRLLKTARGIDLQKKGKTGICKGKNAFDLATANSKQAAADLLRSMPKVVHLIVPAEAEARVETSEPELVARTQLDGDDDWRVVVGMACKGAVQFCVSCFAFWHLYIEPLVSFLLESDSPSAWLTFLAACTGAVVVSKWARISAVLVLVLWSFAYGLFLIYAASSLGGIGHVCVACVSFSLYVWVWMVYDMNFIYGILRSRTNTKSPANSHSTDAREQLRLRIAKLKNLLEKNGVPVSLLRPTSAR